MCWKVGSSPDRNASLGSLSGIAMPALSLGPRRACEDPCEAFLPVSLPRGGCGRLRWAYNRWRFTMQENLCTLKKTIRASNAGRSEYIEELLKSLEFKILSTGNRAKQLQAVLDFEYALPPSPLPKWSKEIESIKASLSSKILAEEGSE